MVSKKFVFMSVGILSAFFSLASGVNATDPQPSLLDARGRAQMAYERLKSLYDSAVQFDYRFRSSGSRMLGGISDFNACVQGSSSPALDCASYLENAKSTFEEFDFILQYGLNKQLSKEPVLRLSTLLVQARLSIKELFKK